jgi:hypothetical protein
VTIPLDVEGPVTAEVLVVAMTDDGPVLTGPCGPAPWLIEAGRDDHPLDTARRIATAALTDLVLLHSTSWRFERNAVILTFLAVVGAVPDGMGRKAIMRADLARGSATSAPPTIGFESVLEHGLRHLAWLAREDVIVGDALDAKWHGYLADLLPEPFQQLSTTGGPA